MISLDLPQYCQNCGDFEAVTAKLYSNGDPPLITISCENSGKCARIAAHIEKTMKELKQNETL